jgi:hypothetical protein
MNIVVLVKQVPGTLWVPETRCNARDLPILVE